MEARAPSEYRPDINLGQETNVPGDKRVWRREAVDRIGALRALQAVLADRSARFLLKKR